MQWLYRRRAPFDSPMMVPKERTITALMREVVPNSGARRFRPITSIITNVLRPAMVPRPAPYPSVMASSHPCDLTSGNTEIMKESRN